MISFVYEQPSMWHFVMATPRNEGISFTWNTVCHGLNGNSDSLEELELVRSSYSSAQSSLLISHLIQCDTYISDNGHQSPPNLE